MHKKYVRFKRDLNRRSERLKTRPRGESTEKGRGKAEIQNELLPLSKKHSQGKQSACFSAEEVRRLKGRLGCAEGGGEVQKKGKSGGPFEHCCGRKSETKSFECGATASAASKTSRPSDAGSFCTASLQKAQKGNGCTFVLRLVPRHCRWLPRILSKRGSAVPKNPSEQKSGSPEVQTEGQQGRCAYRRGRNDRGTEKATEK